MPSFFNTKKIETPEYLESLTHTFVPCSGPIPADIAFLGRNPGKSEGAAKAKAVPFIGAAGKELSVYCDLISLDRESIYISNLFKHFTLGDKPPVQAQYEAHWPLMLKELSLVQPKIICTAGADATEFLMGKCGFSFRGLDAHHGIPCKLQLQISTGEYACQTLATEYIPYFYRQLIDPHEDKFHIDGLTLDFVLMPMIHPASGLHSAKSMSTILQDFRALAELVTHWSNYPFPEPRMPLERRMVKDAAEVLHLIYSAVPDADGHIYMGLDTEGTRWKPWGLTFSMDGENGYCIRVNQKEELAAFAQAIHDLHGVLILIIHNAMWDIDVLKAMEITFADDQFVDTMVYAFNLQLASQGLKPLSYRLLNSSMKDYDDVIRPYDEAKVNTYILQAEQVDWEQCPLCGAAGKLGKMHPVGGAEAWPREGLKKDGMPLKKMLGFIPLCDGGGEEKLLKFEMHGGEMKIRRPWTMGRRLQKMIKEINSSENTNASFDAGDSGLPAEEM